MTIPREGYLLRVFIGESDKWHGKPLYEAIVLKARELHLAGATVLRGPMGFGATSRLHTAKVLPQCLRPDYTLARKALTSQPLFESVAVLGYNTAK